MRNPGINVNWGIDTLHGAERLAERGITPAQVNNWVTNGKALQQAPDKWLLITEEGAAVVNSAGRLITTYSRVDYDANMLAILKQLF